MPDYHQDIIDYYTSTEDAYKDSWDLNNSLSIHYGYWDKQVTSFPQSLLRMNAVMMNAADIKPGNKVLDAGCGVGGSAIFLASLGIQTTGITLSERQAWQADSNAQKKKMSGLASFKVMDYCKTNFADNSFDIVWGCESICYADSKQGFIKEAYRILKPGGRLVIADGFVTKFENNDHRIIRKWLDGWKVNYLETADRFQSYMYGAGFNDIRFKDITRYTRRSARRLYKFYFLSQAYMKWKRMISSRRFSDIQQNNSLACKYQWLGMQKKLWQYGLIVGVKKF